MSCDIQITDSSGIELIEIGTQGPSGPPGSGGAWSATEPVGGYALGDAVTRAKAGVTYLWISAQGSNANHDPATDDETWWTQGDTLNAVGIQFDVSEAVDDPSVEGLLSWSADDKCPQYGSGIAGVSNQIGQELWTPRVKNISGAQIDDGVAVYISGATGANPTIEKAKADSPSTRKVIAIATQDIEHNGFGYCTAFGMVRDIDTSAWAAGTQLYLSADTAGALTSTAPSSPDIAICVGIVIISNASTGSIFVGVRLDPDQFLLHTGGTLTGVKETVVTPDLTAETLTVDCDEANQHYLVVGSNATALAFDNAAVGKYGTITLKIDGTGGYSIGAFTGGDLKWMMTEPTWNTVAGKFNEIRYKIAGDGTTILLWGNAEP